MKRKKTLPTIAMPFAHVHNTLTAFGFAELPAREGTQYQLMFRDPSTLKEYAYRISARTRENGQTQINLNEAGFYGRQPVPEAAEAAAGEMLAELLQYLRNGSGKSASPPIDQVMNGRMANNEAEVKKLGKVMASLPTNSQLMENGLMPDPVQ